MYVYMQIHACIWFTMYMYMCIIYMYMYKLNFALSYSHQLRGSTVEGSPDEGVFPSPILLAEEPIFPDEERDPGN